MSLRNPESNINKIVGQPQIETPLGGRRVPEIRVPRKNHTVRNLAIAGVALSAAVGSATFGASQLNNNDVPKVNPDFTPPAGIVEPSANLPVSPSANIELPTQAPTSKPEIPTSTPEETPESTQISTLEPTPILGIKGIINSEFEKTSAKSVTSSLASVYKSYPELIDDDMFPKSFIENNWEICQNGRPENAGNPKVLLYDRLGACSTLISELNTLFAKTGNKELYDSAIKTYNYTLSSLGNDIKPQLDELLPL